MVGPMRQSGRGFCDNPWTREGSGSNERKGSDMRKALTYLVAATSLVAAVPALAQGDAAEGENVFKKCKACHMVGADAKNRVGPVLNGVVGRPFGQVEDFKYSPNLMELAEGGAVWDHETLTAYLAKPKDVIPKGKMSFAGLKKDEEIQNVIAYLETFE